jgi:thiamine biosynthesis lipoprotein ApbE
LQAAVRGAFGIAATLDGVARGYIVEAGVEVLRQRGSDNVRVEARSDLPAQGQKEQHSPGSFLSEMSVSGSVSN